MHGDESDEAARDRQLAGELEVLKVEREDIISGAAVDRTPELAKSRDILRRKLQIAEDSRQYQLANLRLHLELEKKRAWDEYMTGKARLREQVILSHIERRKRLDAIKLGVLKRRKRQRPPTPSPVKGGMPAAPLPSLATMRPQLAEALESRGLVRIALSPDEVNRDIAQIVARMDNTRAAAAPGPSPSRMELAAGASARKGEAIHSSRGILHFHNEVFEKGDDIIAYLPGKPNPPKHVGLIMSINSKEIQVRSQRPGSDAKTETNRIYVSHLRKDTIRIKHA